MVREHIDALRAGMRRRGATDALSAIDRAAELDKWRRETIQAVEERKAARNAVSQQVGQRKRAGESADDLQQQSRALGDEIARLDRELAQTESELSAILLELPNVTLDQVPAGGEDKYALRDEDVFLIPTAEVPLTNLYRDEIIPESELPKAFTAFSACFRREAGAAGKDTRGLLRVHEFDKVELVRYVTPETAEQQLELLTGHAEQILEHHQQEDGSVRIPAALSTYLGAERLG